MAIVAGPFLPEVGKIYGLFVELELEASELQVCNLMSPDNLVPAEVFVLGGVLADEGRQIDGPALSCGIVAGDPAYPFFPKVFPCLDLHVDAG